MQDRERNAKGQFVPQNEQEKLEKQIREAQARLAEIKRAEAEKLAAERKKAEEERKAKLSAEKTELAHKIEAAYSAYASADEAVVKAKAERDTKAREFNKLRTEFIGKYGSFHMTYVDKKPVVDLENEADKQNISVNDLFNYLFNRYF